MDAANVNARSSVGDAASALAAGGIDGVTKPVGAAGPYPARSGPHRAEGLVSRVTGNRMRSPAVDAPSGMSTVGRRTQYDERIVIVGISVVVPCAGGDGASP